MFEDKDKVLALFDLSHEHLELLEEKFGVEFHGRTPYNQPLHTTGNKEMSARRGQGQLVPYFDRIAGGDVLTNVTAAKHPRTQEITTLFTQTSGIQSLSLYKGQLESIETINGQEIKDRAEMVTKLKKWVALANEG